MIVGNEALLRGDQTVEQMIGHLKRVRKNVWAPVSLAEPWHIWLKYPELVKQVDFIAVHILPYWEGIDVEQAVDYVVFRYEQLKAAYPEKRIVIAEVGWPSNGRTARTPRQLWPIRPNSCAVFSQSRNVKATPII